MPEVRGDWDQAVTRHDQDDLELAHRLAPGVNIQAVEWNFERLDIPSRKTGRPIKGGLYSLANQPTCATRSWAFASAAVAGCAGSWRTVASCPSSTCVRSTICPSGNSSASWWDRGLSLLTCRKIAVVWAIIFAVQPNNPRGRLHLIAVAKASSVPGRTQTAVLASSGAANPIVPVLK